MAATRARRPTGVFAGLCTLDVIHQVDSPPAPNQKVTATAQSVAAGGPATNAAVTFAALGGDALLVTALGDGVAAQIARSDLTACGVRIVDVAPQLVDAVPISSIVVPAGTGERSVVSVDAGAIVLDTAPDLGTVVAGADVILVDGHHPVLAVHTSLAALAASIPLVLDAGRWRPVMDQLLPRVAAVICSADFRVPGTDDPAAALLGRGVPTVLVTRGGDPVLWWRAGRHGAIAPPAVDVVDTAGAGDAFHGAFCYWSARHRDADLADIITAANEVASTKCRFAGTRTWLRHVAHHRAQ